MEPDPQLERLFSERMEDTAEDRQQVLERYAAQDWVGLASVEQTVSRLEYLQQPDMAKDYARRAEESELMGEGMRTGVTAEPTSVGVGDLGQVVFEKIIGHSEVMPIRFMHTGSRVARSVGRIVSRTGRRPNGTGFLISPRLLLTNFHVLRDRADAGSNLVQFNYVARADGSADAPFEFDLQPEVLFLQSPIEELDCALVAVEPVNRSGVELGRFGWSTLVGRVGKEHPGERVNVIHHPGGDTKQVSLRENFMALILDRHLHYMTDTAPGSSGSPVFNDEWEVVALHHAGREITNQREVELYRAALGSNVPGGIDGDEPTVVVNEGVRISQIVEWLGREAEAATGEVRDLLEEALADAFETTSDAGAGVDAPGIAGPPVTINITIGEGTSPAITTSRRAPAAAITGLELFRGEEQRSVLRGLAHLQRRREGAYVPTEAERNDRRSEYYADLPLEVEAGQHSGADLYEALHERISEVGGLTVAGAFPERLEGLEMLHRTTMEGADLESRLVLEDAKYDRSRAHLYTWVDVHPDRMLHCIYTGALIAPEQLLLKDLVTELDMSDELPRRFRNNQFLNCEHVVPQSWFGREPIPRADLHHLFVADGAANNYRSDSIYRMLDNDPAAISGPTSLPEYISHAGLKATGPKRFQPFRSKSIVARATLYFLIAHKGKLKASTIDQDEIDLLVGWSKESDPQEYEIHRNESIFEIQHNRNPLIDFPEWVDHIDFARGVGVSA
jgi:endonuclease I/V8-like Glu-specific endopeptidase